ncbi:unnamed protein product, partial [marine sediment metagenome]
AGLFALVLMSARVFRNMLDLRERRLLAETRAIRDEIVSRERGATGDAEARKRD